MVGKLRQGSWVQGVVIRILYVETCAYKAVLEQLVWRKLS